MVMTNERIKTYAEFWPYYVGEHRSPVCRGFHYAGTLAALSIAAFATITGRPLLILAALVCGYGPAWIGHFFIERNRPATFTYPLWSLISDFRMLGYALSGKMAAEVTRLYGSRNPARDAPLRVSQ